MSAGALLLALSTTLATNGVSVIGWGGSGNSWIYVMAATTILGWALLAGALWRFAISPGTLSWATRGGVRVIAIAAGFGALSGLAELAQGLHQSFWRVSEVGPASNNAQIAFIQVFLDINEAKFACTAALWVVVAAGAFVCWRQLRGSIPPAPSKSAWLAGWIGLAFIGAGNLVILVLVLTSAATSTALIWLAFGSQSFGWCAVLAASEVLVVRKVFTGARVGMTLRLVQIAIVASLTGSGLYLASVLSAPTGIDASLPALYRWIGVPGFVAWLAIAAAGGALATSNREAARAEVSITAQSSI